MKVLNCTKIHTASHDRCAARESNSLETSEPRSCALVRSALDATHDGVGEQSSSRVSRHARTPECAETQA